MLKLDKILCPVDFSEYSAKAYAYAYSLARHYDSKLLVQHVAEPWLELHQSYLSAQFIQDAYDRQLAVIQEQMQLLIEAQPRQKVQIETVIQFGSTADSILALAASRGVDLIAMGTHGRRGMDRFVLGSILERVLRKAGCAVLAVHEPARSFLTPASSAGPVQFRRILCCTDLSESSPRALEFALLVALEYHAELTLLYVMETPGDAAQEHRTMKLLEDAIPDEARAWARAIPLVLIGEPYRKIIEHAIEAETDLIVMGVRGRNIVDLALFGSTTHRVIQLGPCPVLTVRT